MTDHRCGSPSPHRSAETHRHATCDRPLGHRGVCQAHKADGALLMLWDYPEMVWCHTCNGTGRTDACWRCKGSGEIASR